MEEDEGLGFNEKPYKCKYCAKRYSSTQSRTNHHAQKHKRLHEKFRCHKKEPKYYCQFCFCGYGSRQSKYHHEQLCLSNPKLEKVLKTMKKHNIMLKNGLMMIEKDKKSQKEEQEQLE